MITYLNPKFYIHILLGFIIIFGLSSFTTITPTYRYFNSCDDINWATWNNFNGNSAVGTINNGGDIVNVTMSSNFNFGSTPQIYNHSKFNNYPAKIPNSTVPQTTWSKGTGGTTTMCFSKKVTNPVLLIASLGASLPISAKLTFSKPYVVLYDGGNMKYHNSTSLTGTEGYAIIMFPGDFDCVTINSNTEEFYTNITWGIRPPPFDINISEIKTCSSTQLTASEGKSYLWSGGESPTSATNTFTKSGNYNVTITYEDGCSVNIAKSLTIVSVTNNLINTSQTKFCDSKANIIIDGTIPPEMANLSSIFLWQQSGNGLDWTNINNENNRNLSPPEFIETTYFRRVVQIENCKFYSNTIKVEVYPSVSIANAGTDISLCNTSTTQLNANSTTANERGKWTVISPTTYNPFTPQNINDPKAVINDIPINEEILIKWTITQNDCLTETSAQVKIFNYGIPSFSTPTYFTINEGQTLAIPATLIPNANIKYTYTWTPARNLDDPSKLAPNANPDETSIFKLKINYGNCQLEKEIKIIVNKAFRLDVCPSTALTLAGAVDNDASSIYQWQKLVSGTWVDIPNANKFDLDITTPENFTNAAYQIEYRRVVLNSPYYDSRYLLNVATRTEQNIIKTAETNFCATSIDNLQIEGSIPTGAENTTITFQWEKSEDGINWSKLSNSSKDLTVAHLTSTSYFRRITFANTCQSISNVLKIQINPEATIANAGSNASYCGVQTIILDANSARANETGTWTVVSPSNYRPFDAVSQHNPKAKIENLPLNEPVTLMWAIENHNCNSTTSSTITLTSYQDLVIESPVTLNVDLGKKINLNVTANIANGVNYKYEWTPALGLNKSDILSPDASPTNNTEYNLRVSYGDNCFKLITVNVVVLKNIEIPNSFSPNGDGVNDNWEIKNLFNYPGSKVFIYSRYGVTVFQSSSYTTPWNGKHNGKTLPTGTYYYVIKLNDAKKSVYNGSITILN